jgi:hypothetical protein
MSYFSQLRYYLLVYFGLIFKFYMRKEECHKIFHQRFFACNEHHVGPVLFLVFIEITGKPALHKRRTYTKQLLQERIGYRNGCLHTVQPWLFY